MIVCKQCGEWMEGDGYKTVIHCPNADDEEYWYAEPDAGPIYCGFTDQEEEEE